MYPLNFRSQFVTFTPYSKSNFSKIYKNGYSESSKLKGIKSKIIKKIKAICVMVACFVNFWQLKIELNRMLVNCYPE